MAAPLDEPRSSSSSRRQKAIRWIVRLLLLYTVFGFLVLPLIVRAVAARRLARELNRDVTIKSVRINPYTLSCAVRGLLIKDRDGEPFISWDNAYVNFQLASFFGKPWVFKEISATNIYLRAQMNKDYTLNFSDLIEKFSKPAKTTTPSKPLALRVDKLIIGGVRASLTDMTPRTPFRRIVGPLQITLRNFHTDSTSRNPYSFVGSTDSGEVFSWGGNFSLNPIRAEGELSVEGVSLNKYAPLYQDLVRFEIRDGVASFRGGYRFVSGPTNSLVLITNVSAALRSFKLAEAGTADNLVELPAFAVSGISGDLIRRQMDVGSLSVTGAVLNLKRNRDASVNVLEIAKPSAEATNAPGGVLVLLRAVTNVFSMLLSSTNTATATLRDLAVDNCAVTLDDEVNSRPVRLTVDQINVAAKNLSNLPGTNLTANVSLRWNTNGTIRTDLTASTIPLTADVHLVLDQIELRPLDPYLEPYLNLFIIDSKVGLDGRVRLRTEPGQLPVVTFAGGYSLDDFATVDGVLGEDLVKWRSLRLDGIDAGLNPPTVSVAKVQLDDLSARLIIDTNRSINLLTALRPQNTNQPPAGESVTPQTGSPPVRSGTAALTGVKEVMTRTNALAVTGFAKVSIASVVISNAEVQLTDRSVTPEVRTALHQVNGTITDISSDELRRAQIQVEGKVDNSGLVEINGQFNPLHQTAASKVTVTMKDIDLNPSDPYAEKFLGYRLRKGKLSLDVNYEVSARQLKGQNLVHLDQLTLGQKVASPDATKLPVKLAIAVLKDRSGKIDLDVPVEGSLDDPQFHLGRVIWHAVGNVFTKIITSPFSVLSALLGGKGEEVSYQDFNPGTAELLPAAKEKLDALGKALYERPGLEVEVEGNADPVTDRDGLRRVKLEQQMRVRKWTDLRKSEQAATSPQQIVLTPEERERFLAELLAKAAADAAARSPDSRAPGRTTGRSATATDTSSKGAEALLRPRLTPEERQQIVSDSERQLMDAIPVEPGELRDLAAERARQVQNYLVQTVKVEPERVYLTQSSAGTNGHRVYLHLQ